MIRNAINKFKLHRFKKNIKALRELGLEKEAKHLELNGIKYKEHWNSINNAIKMSNRRPTYVKLVLEEIGIEL